MNFASSSARSIPVISGTKKYVIRMPVVPQIAIQCSKISALIIDEVQVIIPAIMKVHLNVGVSRQYQQRKVSKAYFFPKCS